MRPQSLGIAKRVLWPASIMMVLTRIRFFRPFCSQFSTEGEKIVIQLQQGLVQQAACEGSIQASRGLVFLLSFSVFALLYDVPIISLWYFLCLRSSRLNNIMLIFSTLCAKYFIICYVYHVSKEIQSPPELC